MQPTVTTPGARKNWSSRAWRPLATFSESSWALSGGTTAMVQKFGRATPFSRWWKPEGNFTLSMPGGSFSKTVRQLKKIGLWVYVEPAGGVIAGIRITFGETGYANSTSWFWAGPILREGWNFLVVDYAEDGKAWSAPAAWTINGLGAFTNIFDRIQIQINATGVNYYFGGLYYEPPTTAVIFGIDNGAAIDGSSAPLLSIFDTIYPKFNSYGWAGYLAVPGIGYAVNLSTARTSTMYAAGWDVVNHSTTHVDFTALTDQQIRAEVFNQKDFMRTNGWTRTLDYGAYPGNTTNVRVATLLQSWGEKWWRALFGRYAFAQNKFLFPESPLQFPSIDASPLTLVQLQDTTNAAIRMRASAVCYFTHGLDAVSGALYMDAAIFDAWANWLRTMELTGDIEVITPLRYVTNIQTPP